MVLREAGRPLRERAGRESLDMTVDQLAKELHELKRGRKTPLSSDRNV
jgi:hypothetical protein